MCKHTFQVGDSYEHRVYLGSQYYKLLTTGRWKEAAVYNKIIQYTSAH